MYLGSKSLQRSKGLFNFHLFAYKMVWPNNIGSYKIANWFKPQVLDLLIWAQFIFIRPNIAGRDVRLSKKN